MTDTSHSHTTDGERPEKRVTRIDDDSLRLACDQLRRQFAMQKDPEKQRQQRDRELGLR
jgi:hypothetical protein